MRSESASQPRQIAAVCATTLLLGCSGILNAQQVRSGVGIYPPSSIERPEDVGVRMHTNYILYAPTGSIVPAVQPAGETPASLGCVYGIVFHTGCGMPNQRNHSESHRWRRCHRDCRCLRLPIGSGRPVYVLQHLRLAAG